jgi:hypothetical protein
MLQSFNLFERFEYGLDVSGLLLFSNTTEFDNLQSVESIAGLLLENVPFLLKVLF